MRGPARASLAAVGTIAALALLVLPTVYVATADHEPIRTNCAFYCPQNPPAHPPTPNPGVGNGAGQGGENGNAGNANGNGAGAATTPAPVATTETPLEPAGTPDTAATDGDGAADAGDDIPLESTGNTGTVPAPGSPGEVNAAVSGSGLSIPTLGFAAGALALVAGAILLIALRKKP